MPRDTFKDGNGSRINHSHLLFHGPHSNSDVVGHCFAVIAADAGYEYPTRTVGLIQTPVMALSGLCRSESDSIRMPLHDMRPGCWGLVRTEEGLGSIEKAACRKPLFVFFVNVTAYIGILHIASYTRRSNSSELEDREVTAVSGVQKCDCILGLGFKVTIWAVWATPGRPRKRTK